MPTTSIAVFEQAELQAIADTALCHEATEKLEAEVHLPDNFYVGVLHRLVCAANGIPDALILKCRFASNMQGAGLSKYLLFYLNKDGEWVLNDTKGVEVDAKYVGEDPTFRTLQTFGLFARRR